MDINSVRLINFKGFQDATLNLKPLTVILGPNSAGKSCFGQALVALSKSNAKNDILNLAFDNNSSIDFGGYSDLIHHGCEGQDVIVEIGFSSVTVRLGFGSGNPKANIKELELTHMEVRETPRPLPVFVEEASGSVSQTIVTPFTEYTPHLYAEIESLSRDTNREWTVVKESGGGVQEGNSTDTQKINVKFHGISIDTISNQNGTAVNLNEVVPHSKLRFDYLASFLRGISYLRPDREAPLRKKKITSDNSTTIDDFGGGTEWFIHNNRSNRFVTFLFPDPSTDKEESKLRLAQYLSTEPEEMPLVEALAFWLKKLGLASFLDIRLLDEGRSTQSIATPIGQHAPRPLADLGFGVSQVLPILTKGLTIKKGDLLVVEQPEAQLHPKPQAELADFFCSMVKCGRNVIVETHSVDLFHRLRLRASMDESLAEKIAVYFVDEPVNGACCEAIPIPLKEDSELEWPKGFLPEGLEKELEILAIRLARAEQQK